MSSRSPLSSRAHRPWPLPEGPHALVMSWHELLFLHWPMPPAALRALLPPGLELELFDGAAWLGVVPFRMAGVRLRGLPPLPGTRSFPELNLRTYVRSGERSGVWFLSLDAASRLAVLGARAWFHLPYHFAAMRCSARDGRVDYASARRGPIAAAFAARYRPTGPVAPPDELARFLSERYALYAFDARRRRLLQGEIHHEPWPLQPAEVELEHCSLERPHGLALPPSPPLAHYAHELHVLAWAPRVV